MVLLRVVMGVEVKGSRKSGSGPGVPYSTKVEIFSKVPVCSKVVSTSGMKEATGLRDRLC
jgi:hypothetical protein